MPLLSFNKASDPLAPDDLRINPAAVLYVEASRPDLIGQTTIHLLGQGVGVHAVTESLDTVVTAIGGLIAATRHYLVPPPDASASTLYLCPRNISHLRPNLPARDGKFNRMSPRISPYRVLRNSCLPSGGRLTRQEFLPHWAQAGCLGSYWGQTPISLRCIAPRPPGEP